MASANIPDLIEHFKLETEFHEEHTVEIAHALQHDRGRRRVKTETIWTKREHLGDGAYGTVWLEKNQSGATRAVKQVRKTRFGRIGNDWHVEVLALAKLSKHEDLFVKFYGWFENVNSIFIAMEYFQRGDLFKVIQIVGPCMEQEAKRITAQLLEGLSIIHDMGFTHRDLKPQNIFVAQRVPEWWIKIGDFGISKRVRGDDATALRTHVGTLGYLAPEAQGLLDDDETEYEGYTNAVDIWSLGCVAYWLLTQEVPFSSTWTKDEYVRGSIEFPLAPLLVKRITEEGLHFIRKAMAVQPLDRFTASTALDDYWLNNVNDTPHLDPRLQNDALHTSIGFLGGNADEPTSDQETSTGISQSNDRAINHESEFGRASAIGNTENPGLQVNDSMTNIIQDLNGLTTNDDTVPLRLQEDRNQRVSQPALNQDLTRPSAIRDAQSIQLLLANGFDVSSANFNASKALLWTVTENHGERMAEFLLGEGADVATKDGEGWTVLHRAAGSGQEAVVRLLLKNDADTTMKDHDKWTALHRAARNGHETVVQFLLGEFDHATAIQSSGVVEVVYWKEPVDAVTAIPSVHGTTIRLSISTLQNALDKMELLYENGLMTVWRASLKEGLLSFIGPCKDLYAIKQFRPRHRRQEADLMRAFKQELKVLKKLPSRDHRHILQLLGAYIVHPATGVGHFGFIFPYADGGDLQAFLRLPTCPDWLTRSTLMSFREILFDQVCGITHGAAFIHSKESMDSHFIHGDIKPSNVLIENGIFKLADFGISRIKQTEETSKTDWYTGTPYYAPPERTTGTTEVFGRARDNWALGCVILEIVVLMVHGFATEPVVDRFEEERLDHSGTLEVKAFSLTMGCVRNWMADLGQEVDSSLPNNERNLVRALLTVAQDMLEINPLDRMTSQAAQKHLYECLEPG